MSRPVIGLVPLVDRERESYWMLPGYMDGIVQGGGLPFMLPLTRDAVALRQLFDMCSGILFTGGQDVSPSVYGQQDAGLCGETCPDRDSMEWVLLELAVEYRKPVLGICRGIQFINSCLGGTLYQDLSSEHPSDVVHQQKPPYHKPSHGVDILPGTPLGDLLGSGTIEVNSCHHQAVDRLAPGLSPMAVSPDGLTEALWMEDHPFLWAVQWHPEFSWKVSPESRAVFTAFCSAAEAFSPGAFLE